MDINFGLKSAMRNRLLVMLTIAATLITNTNALAQNPEQWKTMRGDVTLFLANDLGRNGYYEQKPIAELMGTMADELGPEAVLALGDVHHFEGVQSTADPLWMTNYEFIYTHPELMIAWLPVLGNHEYRGNTQAVLDYSQVSRRWQMESRYYSRVFADEEHQVSVRVVFIDTTPMIDRYHHSITYPDVDRQDVEAQLAWIDQTLRDAQEDWVVVVGHHPIYAQTKKDIIEQDDMQRRLLPILNKHKQKVAMYVCGHIHNFQHIRRGNDGIDYVVNSSASLARKVSETTGTVYCSPSEGFSVLSATKQQLCLYMIDKAGNTLHRIERTR